jgi:hypothetical protein
MDHPAALHRLQVGVPATVEHSSEAGPETGKWVAETTQVRLMDNIFRSSFPLYVFSWCTPGASTPLHFVILTLIFLRLSCLVYKAALIPRLPLSHLQLIFGSVILAFA